jgi:Raf kinase inhibitor-like YbhB/YbcL family protein
MRQALIIPPFVLAAALAMTGCGKAAETPAAAPPASLPAKLAKPLALDLAPPMSGIPLPVSSLAIGSGGRLADRNTAYHENLSPPLAWGSIGGVQSWVVIVEDPDANRPRPYVHWLAWNLPPRTASLPEGLTAATAPPGMIQGFNSGLGPGWGGPKPPKGTGDHHYHFEVFALDTVLTLPRLASRDDVATAMKGHVLASGEALAVYAAP